MKKAAKKKVATRKRLGDDRVEELLEIAGEVFLTDGFAAASTNEIARRANASKTTFYSRFPTKEDLFVAVVEQRMTRIFAEVAAFPEKPTVEKTLRAFGESLLRTALSADQMRLIRMISMEAERYPALATRFYELGPKRGEHALAAYLSQQMEARQLRRGHALTMAQQLIGLLTGSPVRWFVLGFEQAALDPATVRRHVRGAVAMFLRAYDPA